MKIHTHTHVHLQHLGCSSPGVGLNLYGFMCVNPPNAASFMWRHFPPPPFLPTSSLPSFLRLPSIHPAAKRPAGESFPRLCCCSQRNSAQGPPFIIPPDPKATHASATDPPTLLGYPGSDPDRHPQASSYRIPRSRLKKEGLDIK